MTLEPELIKGYWIKKYKSIRVELTKLHSEEGYALQTELFGPDARNVTCIGVIDGYVLPELVFEYEVPAKEESE
jgi:hypothetical protein